MRCRRQGQWQQRWRQREEEIPCRWNRASLSPHKHCPHATAAARSSSSSAANSSTTTSSSTAHCYSHVASSSHYWKKRRSKGNPATSLDKLYIYGHYYYHYCVDFGWRRELCLRIIMITSLLWSGVLYLYYLLFCQGSCLCYRRLRPRKHFIHINCQCECACVSSSIN